MTDLLSLEVAQNQIDVFFSHYKYDITIASDEQQDALNEILPKLVSGIRRGSLEITKEGSELKMIQNLEEEYDKLSGETSITYKELTAKILRLIPDPSEKANHYVRTFSLVQGLTGLSKNQIDQFTLGDLTLVKALGAVFFLF